MYSFFSTMTHFWCIYSISMHGKTKDVYKIYVLGKM